MPRWLYSLLLYLALPGAALRLWWRGWRNSHQRDSLAARLGWGLAPRTDRPLWMHAASLGELRALAALLQVLEREAIPVLVTVGTPTGLARAHGMFAGDAQVSVLAVPWDLPGAVRRFFEAARPRGAVFVETELWPNLIAGARSRGLPLALVSARLSERSLRGYLRWAPALLRDTVRAFGAIGAQGEADRRRFIELGAEAARVSVTGNLKFDVPLDAQVPARGAALRARWAPHRPLWVAGSTHPGEEAMLLDAQRRLLGAGGRSGGVAPLLALAPRRPERFAGVARWLGASGLRHATVQAQAGESQPTDPDVLLINEMGTLQEWYAAADVAFVGGSLVPVGGHNLLEPAALGRPVLTGPHLFNAPDVAQSLIEAGAARIVADVAALADGLGEWLGRPATAAQAGVQAASTVAAHRGAAMRARALIARWSEPSASD
jgi:3-deoxy-D-manno-octulosonic-acid transferase